MSRRIRPIFRLPSSARRVERDVDAEVTFHLDSRTDALIEAGMPREAARAQALREFGDVALARHELRAIDEAREGRVRWREMWSDLGRDLRVAGRSLRRQPTFLVVALATLALGIGANAAIFSVVDAVLLRPLPYREPERLVSIWPEGAAPKGGLTMLRERTRALVGVAAYGDAREVSLTGGDEPLRLTASEVSGDLFDVLGVGARVGRTLARGDESPGAPPVVVLGHALWRQHFGGRPDVVGRTATIDGVPRTIVGVMPESFHFPSPAIQLWLPATLDPARVGEYWGYSWLRLVGRLAPGVGPERARRDVAPIFDLVRAAFPWRMPDAWGRDVGVVSLQEKVVGGAEPTLLLLLGAAVVVLLVACVNVANLSLARAIGRARELAIRTALGAGRARVVRQLVAESLLLAAIGGALGVLLAMGLVRAMLPLLPAGVPRVAEIGVDARVLLFTAAVTVLTGVLFGLVPAVRASRPDVQAALKTGTQGSGGGRRRLAEGLVVAELALAVVLVVAAGLLAKSFWRLRQVDPGFRSEHVIAADVPIPAFASDTAARSRDFYDAVLDRVRAIPGVREAAVTSELPFGDGFAWAAVEIESHPTPPGAVAPTPNVVSVSPEYPRVMGIPLLAGRALAASDREGATLVALVDEVAARRLWPGEDPLGKRLRYVWQRDWITVVGLVGAVKRDSLNAVEQPSVYRPLRQGLPASMRLVARADLPADALAPAVRAAVAAVDAGVPIREVRSLGSIVADSAARPRFTMALLLLFATAALVLGVVGIYGVAAYAVSRRTREIGVRIALGARARDVAYMVVRDAGRLVGLGLVLGVVLALAATRLLRGLLFGVEPADPLVLLAVPLLLAAAAVVASALPARRATRVDPLVAMRSD